MFWPAGPHYFDLTGSEGAVAWVRYRVRAADWYTRTLQTIAGPDGNYDRLFGIEMALDGALSNLSGAFDAATLLLIRGAETKLAVATEEQNPPHRCSWQHARNMLKQPAIGTNPDGTSNPQVWRVILDVDNALVGDRDDTPTGWLAQLRRLRNRVTHQDSLARHHRGTPGKVTLRILDQQDADPFIYLAHTCDKIHDLTQQMIALAIGLSAADTAPGHDRPRWFP